MSANWQMQTHNLSWLRYDWLGWKTFEEKVRIVCRRSGVCFKTFRRWRGIGSDIVRFYTTFSGRFSYGQPCILERGPRWSPMKAASLVHWTHDSGHDRDRLGTVEVLAPGFPNCAGNAQK